MNNTGMLYTPNTSISQPLAYNPGLKMAQSKASTQFSALASMSGPELKKGKAMMGMLKPDNSAQIVSDANKPGGNAGGKH